jgi:hypothetical protein
VVVISCNFCRGKKSVEDYIQLIKKKKKKKTESWVVILCNLCRGKKNIEEYTIDLQEEEEEELDLIMGCHIM